MGRDALWSELAELAAVRGAQVHLHLAYDRDVSPGVLAPSAPAVDQPGQLPHPNRAGRTRPIRATCRGPARRRRAAAAIWEDFRREPHRTARRAGHGPWSAYRLAEASEEEELLCVRQTVLSVNAHWEQMTGTINPHMRPWFAVGVQAIYADQSTPAASPTTAPVLTGAHA